MAWHGMLLRCLGFCFFCLIFFLIDTRQSHLGKKELQLIKRLHHIALMQDHMNVFLINDQYGRA